MQNPPGGGPPPGHGAPQGQHGTQVMAQYPVAPPPPQQPEQPTQPLPPPASYGQPAAPPIQQPQVYMPPQGQPPPMQQGMPQAMQPVANAQWGPQGQPPSRVVYGVPLEPTEKVIYFYKSSHLGSRIFLFIMGIFLIPALGIGLLMIYAAITDRKSATYAQVISNKRLIAINGHGSPLWQIRWEDVRGLNKITGRRYEFGVRNAQGTKFMFNDNVAFVEMVITKLAENPMLREQSPEVPYESIVT